jgi:hypothetical protein
LVERFCGFDRLHLLFGARGLNHRSWVMSAASCGRRTTPDVVSDRDLAPSRAVGTVLIQYRWVLRQGSVVREVPADQGGRRDRARVLVPDHGGQLMRALTAVATPAVTVAVAVPGWQPGRLVVTL